MFLSVLAIVLIGFSPTVPAGVPQGGSFRIVQGNHVERAITDDLGYSLVDGGQVLRFIQKRGVCPAALGADCRYTARYELTSIDNGTTEGKVYVHRYAVLGPNDVRVEGLLVSYGDGGRRFVYRLNGHSWKQESAGDETGDAAAFIALLFQLTQGLPVR